MGELFVRTLRGRSPAYNEIMSIQREHHQHACYPRAWKVSLNLGNPRHFDADASRSVACWLRERGEGGEEASEWMLLFPDHGVGVLLADGVFVDWDGKKCAHLTILPNLAEGEMLLSAFVALPASVHAACRKKAAMSAAVGQAGRSRAFTIGDKVSVKVPCEGGKAPKSKAARRKLGKSAYVVRHGVVVESPADAALSVRLEGGSTLELLSQVDVHNRVVMRLSV